MNSKIPAALTLLLLAAGAGAAVPVTDAYLPSVAHGQGVCINGVCSQWQTTVWLFNPTAQTATVRLAFLARDTDNSNPSTQDLTLGAGETRQLDDVIKQTFGLDPAYGALRVTSAVPIVVSSRVYDANVVTSKGTGSAGQYFAALPAGEAVGTGEFVDLVGLAQDADGAWRSNFGFVETTGQSCTVEAQPIGADGQPLTQVAISYSLRPREARQFFLSDLGGPAGVNRRVRMRVTSGDGRVVAFGSIIDNRTGDPSTAEMAGAGRNGTYLAKLDKPVYDTPLTLTVAGNAVTGMDMTIVFTDEDVASCVNAQLLRVAGSLPQPVVIEDDGSFSFAITSVVDGVGVSIQVNGTIAGRGALSGNATTTLTGASGCNGGKTWPVRGSKL